MLCLEVHEKTAAKALNLKKNHEGLSKKFLCHPQLHKCNLNKILIMMLPESKINFEINISFIVHELTLFFKHWYRQ